MDLYSLFAPTDSEVIVSKFAAHFSKTCTANNESKARFLHSKYCVMRASYSGLPLQERHVIDAELVSKCYLTYLILLGRYINFTR